MQTTRRPSHVLLGAWVATGKKQLVGLTLMDKKEKKKREKNKRREEKRMKIEINNQ
jgi:hypothetical protein